MFQTTKGQLGWLFGILLCVLAIGVSASIDLYSAWGLARNAVEKPILLAVAALAVLWKAFGSVKLRSLWIERRYGAMVLPGALLLVALAVSCGMELRLYKRLFSETAEARLTAGDDRASLKADIDRLEAQIKWQPKEPVATLEAKVAAREADQVYKITAGCKQTVPGALEIWCREHRQAVVDLANAREHAKTIEKRDALRAKLRQTEAVSGGDPLADTLHAALGVPKEHAMAMMALGFMLIIQLGSLGLPFAYFGGTSPAAPSGELTLVSDNSAEIDRVAEFTETYIMQDKDETAPLRAQDAFALFKAVTGSDLDSKRAFGSRFVKALDTIGFSYTRVRVGGFGHTAYQGINLTPGGWRLLERKKEEAA